MKNNLFPNYFYLVVITSFLLSCNKSLSELEQMPTLPFENELIKLAHVNYSSPKFSRGLHFFDENTGICTSLEGQIFHTKNGGTTWTKVFESNVQLGNVMFLDAQNGFVIGAPHDETKGLVLKTNDSGLTWQVVYQATKGNIKGIAKSNQRLYILEATFDAPQSPRCNILTSDFSGTNWNLSGYFTGFHAHNLYFHESNLFVTGGVGQGKIYKSSDEGVNWSSTIIPNSLYTTEMAFLNNKAYCAIDQHRIFQTTDYTNWVQIKDFDVASFYQMSAHQTAKIILWGNGKYTGGDFGHWYGKFSITNDAGVTWKSQEIAGVNFTVVHFYNNQQGYSMTNDGSLIKINLKN